MVKSFTREMVVPEDDWRLIRIWNVYGSLATVIPMMAIDQMVFKAD